MQNANEWFFPQRNPLPREEGTGVRYASLPSHHTMLGAFLLNTMHGGVVEKSRSTRAALVVAESLDGQPISQAARLGDRDDLARAALRTGI